MRMRTQIAGAYAGIALANLSLALLNVRSGAPFWSNVVFIGGGIAFAVLAVYEYRRDEYEFATGRVERVYRITSPLALVVGVGLGLGCLGWLLLSL